jgi:DNA-directed RNA polymerase II subunit RPB2
MVCPAETPEG